VYQYLSRPAVDFFIQHDVSHWIAKHQSRALETHPDSDLSQPLGSIPSHIFAGQVRLAVEPVEPHISRLDASVCW